MTRIAKDYSISDAGLAKICVGYRIPTPPRWYGAKKRTGNPPPRPPLPTGTTANRPACAAGSTESSGAAKGELAAAIAREKSAKNQILVTKRPSASCAWFAKRGRSSTRSCARA